MALPVFVTPTPDDEQRIPVTIANAAAELRAVRRGLAMGGFTLSGDPLMQHAFRRSSPPPRR
jgi:hypothetical protein